MTRTEAWEKEWRLVAKEKDYSLVDEIYHPDYKAVSKITGIEVNLEADKEAYPAFIEHLMVAPAKIINESEDFLCIQRYSKYREADFFIRNNFYHLQRWKNNYPREYWGRTRLRPQRRSGLELGRLRVIGES